MEANTRTRIKSWVQNLEPLSAQPPQEFTFDESLIANDLHPISPLSFSPTNSPRKHKAELEAISMPSSPTKRPRPDDGESILPSESASLVLPPPTEIMSQNRSSSPTRTKVNFNLTTPMVEMISQDSSDIDIPEEVLKLHDELFLPSDSLPTRFKSYLKTAFSNGYLFDERNQYDKELSAAEDWQLSEEIRNMTRSFVAGSTDENAWVMATDKVLNAVLPKSLEVVSVQTQTIHADYLPKKRIGNNLVAVNRKTDLGIAYSLSRQNEENLQLLSEQSNTRWSSMFAAEDSSKLFCACIEIKQHSGDLKGAEEQLKVWAASYGKWMQAFAHTKPIDETPPIICANVIGDAWRFYLGFWRKTDFGTGRLKRSNQDQLCLWGPLPTLNQSTESCYSILRLFQQLRKIGFYWDRVFKTKLLEQLGLAEL
ncbi:MAG: hypothetical protein M1834_008464 [Cirrosporium novae-zelandiae]|nr:MAG: hypothetical protein M1834_008464 [Cirrosporium novae-zelandiae]